MSDFTVAVPLVAQTSHATRSASDELGAELRALRHEVEAVLEGRWRGEAATAFDRAWGEWHGAAVELLAALERLGDLLADTARSYQDYEDGATSGLTRLSLALPGR